MWIYKIGVRLGIAFMSMVVLVVFMTTYSYFKLESMKQRVDSLTKVSFAKAHASNSMTIAFQNVLRSLFLSVAVDDKDLRNSQQQSIESERGIYRASLKDLENLETTEKGKALIATIKELLVPLAAADSKALNLALKGKSIEAGEVLAHESDPKIKPFLNAVDNLTAYYKETVDSDYKQAEATYHSAVLWLSLLAVFSVVIATVCSVLITRSIIRPLTGMRDMIHDIAQGEGDLTKRLISTNRDEIGDISRSFNMFVEKLHGLIGRISQTTVTLADASSQLQSTAKRMAAGAEEVTAQAGTVATAGEEMSATSSDIAQNCGMAAEGSRHASTAAVSGAKIVDETIAVMNSITERVKDAAKSVENLGNRSEQIGTIVGTIEDIADQTNLLALNAAIEAARAGEQGRGFAVVADEVRALAERTTKATKEISEMIKTIQNETKETVKTMDVGVGEVVRGCEKAAESGRALGSILEKINEVTMQINQVATAAEEQTATTAEISSNMHQITEVVAQTSRGASESAMAEDQLSGLAEELKRVVGNFKQSHS